MPTNKQEKAIHLYANIMQEIKTRLSSINIILATPLHSPAQITRELCYLQLRMICELIALGCLTAHGDIKATTKLENEFAADKIINLLEKLHPNFYPAPTLQTRTAFNRIHIEKRDIAIFLTKEELVTLYNRKCGGILHKGSMKKLLSDNAPYESDFSDITHWTQKIYNLLFHHTITLADNKSLIICMINNGYDDKTNVAFAEVKEPA